MQEPDFQENEYMYDDFDLEADIASCKLVISEWYIVEYKMLLLLVLSVFFLLLLNLLFLSFASSCCCKLLLLHVVIFMQPRRLVSVLWQYKYM